LVRENFTSHYMSNLDTETGVKGRRPDPPVPAEPVTMWMIEQIEIFSADPATPLVAKHLAAAYLFCYYTVMRVEKAQSCWIDVIQDDDFIEDYAFLDKTPKRDKMQPRPWWTPLYDIKKPRYRATAGNSDSTDAGIENVLRKMWAGNSPNFLQSEKFDCLCQNKRPT